MVTPRVTHVVLVLCLLVLAVPTITFDASPGRSGAALVYSTYLNHEFSGNVKHYLTDVAMDSEGNSYVAGYSDIDDRYMGTVTKFDSGGRVLYQATIQPYMVLMTVEGIAVDTSGAATIVGSMYCSAASFCDQSLWFGMAAMVARFDPSGDLILLKFLRGSGDDRATDIALGPDGSLYVAGTTTSPDFPGAGNALAGGTDVFVATLAPDGTVVSTALIGGTRDERAAALLRAEDGSLVLVGTTSSPDFPVRSEGGHVAPQATYGGGASDLFIATLRHGMIERSTFWGGSGADRASDAVLIPGPGACTVSTGTTDSVDFPLLRPIAPDATVVPPQGFLLKMAHGPKQDRVVFSTLLDESGGAVATDASGDIYFSGPNTFAGKLHRSGQIDYLFHGVAATAMAVGEAAAITIVGEPWDWVPVFRAKLPLSGQTFIARLTESSNPGAMLEQDDPSVAYSGTWTQVQSADDSGRSAATSSEAGARAVIRFTGAGIQVLGFRGPEAGILRYTIFDETVNKEVEVDFYPVDRSLDTYASRDEARSLLISFEGLNPAHTYRMAIEVTGLKNPHSRGSAIVIDGFNVLDGD